ncbi:MAG: hypothetical protein U0Q18_30820 [Bryobacteraceae bacterium]
MKSVHVAFAARVREISRNGLGVHVFSGLEWSRDGCSVWAFVALAAAPDVVIGSVHSHMNLESATK